MAPIIVTEDIFYEGKIEMLLQETSKISRPLRRRERVGGYPPELIEWVPGTQKLIELTSYAKLLQY